MKRGRGKAAAAKAHLANARRRAAARRTRPRQDKRHGPRPSPARKQDALPAPGLAPAPSIGLSHYAAEGGVRMVDVSAKPPTYREAEARAFVALRPAVLAALSRNPKGDPLEISRIAGIAGAKRTAELIPLCHTLPLSRIQVEARRARGGVRLTSRVGTTAATGVEMEALTAVSIAALTLYDMCKALDHGITIRDIELTRKSGGLSGDFRRPPQGKRLRRRA